MLIVTKQYEETFILRCIEKCHITLNLQQQIEEIHIRDASIEKEIVNIQRSHISSVSML